MLDHHQGMAAGDEPAQRRNQHRDVGEVQPGGGLVHQEQHAHGGGLGARGAGLGARSLARQVSGELEPLGLAARQGRHRLAEAQIAEPDGGQRFQGQGELRVPIEQGQGLAGGQLQHVGDGEAAGGVVARGQTHLEHRVPIAAAVAVRAAQIDVGEELHLHMLEAVAAAGGAAAVAGVEAEGAGGVAALAGRGQAREALADQVEGADVARGVGARAAPDGRLVQ